MMKKTSIYLLSVIVLAIVGCSVIMPAVTMLKAYCEGFRAGFEAGLENEEELKIGSPVSIRFLPETSTVLQPSDSIAFDNGKRLPILIDEVTVILPSDNVPAWYVSTIGVCYLLHLALVIILIWNFIRFIINISKEKVFVKDNVKYLRRFSWVLIGIALIDIVAGVICELFLSSSSFTMRGYQLEASWIFPWSNLLLGCLSLLFAQVWARGIEIQEEQQLTI